MSGLRSQSCSSLWSRPTFWGSNPLKNLTFRRVPRTSEAKGLKAWWLQSKQLRFPVSSFQNAGWKSGTQAQNDAVPTSELCSLATDTQRLCTVLNTFEEKYFLCKSCLVLSRHQTHSLVCRGRIKSFARSVFRAWIQLQLTWAPAIVWDVKHLDFLYPESVKWC